MRSRHRPRTKNPSKELPSRGRKESNASNVSRLLHFLEEMDKFHHSFADKKLISPRYYNLNTFFDFPFAELLKYQKL